MRILFCHRPGGAFGYITDGMINALLASNHIVQRWDGQQRTWDEFGPELYCGCSSHRQPIPKVRKAKIAIHVNPYCDTNLDGINESQDAINWVLRQEPDVVFGYGHQSDQAYWSHWFERHKIPWAPMPTAGDSVLYILTNSNRTSDIGYVGGYWPYKARTINKYLLPVLSDKQFKTNVFGWGDWPNNVCKGPIDDTNVARVFNEAKIGPCISEPHTLKWGIDLPERLFKVALCGALVIHDPVFGLERFMPSAVKAKDPEDYRALCKRFIENDDERLALVQKQRMEVLHKNTYFDRIATLLMGIGSTQNDERFKAESLKILVSKLDYV